MSMARTTPRGAPTEMKCPMSLAEVDLFSPGAQEHWYEAYPILHAQAPVHRIPGEGMTPDKDAFILSKFDDIAMVVRDGVRFPVLQFADAPPADEDDIKPPRNVSQIANQTLRPNPEMWQAHRQELTEPWVGAGATRHREMIARNANRLIDNWIDRGEVDFVGEFARPLPQIVMATVLGFPLEDIPQLAVWGGAQVKPFVFGRGHRNILTPEEIDDQTRVLTGFAAYVQEQVDEKRRRPKEDMISFLTEVTYSPIGRKLTDDEINGIVYGMVIGGLETTQYAIAEQAQLLCEDPALFATLKADRSKLTRFTEEALRLRSPTQGLSTRITSRDEVFQGVTVPKGSSLHLRWAAANRDPDEFERADEILLDRKAVTRHVAFSQGPRSCPGSGISRQEQHIAWECLMDRLDALEYAPGNTFEHQPGIMLGLYELHLRFTKAA
jgi:cytochrome P450